jgi:hypothetical protein
MVGDMGRAILFMVSLAGTAIVAAYVLAYAARCLLVVVQGTAAGQDAVTWPDEPIMDWLGQAVHVAFLLALWLAPAGLLARGLRHVWLPDDPGLRTLLLAAPGLWLFFPVGLLSSLSAGSPWVPFRPVIVGRLLRLLPATFAFYLVSLGLAAAAIYPWYVALRGMSYLLPVAAIVSAVLLLVYARLLGRIAWLVGRLAPLGSSSRPERPQGKPARRKKPRPRVEDPWAAPGMEVVEKQADDSPPARPRKKRREHEPPLPDEIEAYGLVTEEVKPPAPAPTGPLRREPPPPPRPAPEPPSTAPVEARFLDRPPEYVPRSPLLEGVYTFPFYPQNLAGLVALSAGFLVVGFGILGMVTFWPQ